MKIIVRTFWGALFAAMMLPNWASAEDCKCAPTARLTRVMDGTFELKVRDSIDLTNTGVLLTFLSFGRKYNEGQIYNIRINGKNHQSYIGERFNVNDHRLKAGGFLLRLKAGLVRHSADWVPQTNLVF